jgi:alanine racemase
MKLWSLEVTAIKHPILILGYTSPEDFEKLVYNNITQTIYDLNSAKMLSQTAVSCGKIAKIHIAVDTV